MPTNNVLISIVSGVLGLLGIMGAAIIGLRQTKITAKTADNQTTIAGTNTAINGLEVLAQQHATEIERLNKKYVEYVLQCETDKVMFTRQIAVHEGQIDVLKLAATGITGPQGNPGLQGKTGEKGEKGSPGGKGGDGGAGGAAPNSPGEPGKLGENA